MARWSPAGPRGLDSRTLVEAVTRLTLAWRALPLARGDRVAILSENRPEWLMADYSLLAAGAVSVPIYTTLPPAQIRYILADCRAAGIVVSTPELLARVTAVRESLPDLKHLVLMDAESGDGPVTAFKELVQRGADLRLRDPDAFSRLAHAADPGELASIIYTSGTTGPPKGVMLTHGNFVSNVLATQEVFDFSPSDRALSFLPLSHVFERTVDYVYMHRGVSIVHVDLENLTQALPAMRPTIIAGVPRLYEKVRERVEARVAAAPPARRRLFEWARRTGRAVNYAPLGGGKPPGIRDKLAYAVADRLALRKVRAALGGRLRFAVSGGAPLPREVLEFFCSMGVTIVEGYGLTETSPVIAANSPGGVRPGSVGRPLQGVEVRIAPDGEILTRGPCVMKGYFNDPEATDKVMEGGWFHTGDIGRLDEDGFLYITDRKKDLIVTSGGKNVAPQAVEAALKSTGIITQALVIGNGRRFVTALVVPDPEVLEKFRKMRGAGAANAAEAIEHPGVVGAFQEAVDEAMKDFASFEKVRKIKLLPTEFTIAGGELTPTMKVRRRVVEEKYREAIEALYASDGAEEK